MSQHQPHEACSEKAHKEVGSYAAMAMSTMKGLFVTVSIVSALWIGFVVGPVLETRYFPVLSKMQILSVSPLSESTSAVTARFSKLRNCAYIGVAWYRGTGPNEFHRVSMNAIKDPDDVSAPGRAPGDQIVGPWRVTMPAEEVRPNSYVQVFHRCNPWWTTVTEFYP